MAAANHIDAMISAMRAAGISPANPGFIPPFDGKVSRFDIEGRPTGKKHGWIVASEDGGDAWGAFGDWKSDIRETWCSRSELAMTPAERQDFARRRAEVDAKVESERAQMAARAATRAAEMTEKGRPVSADHPYIVRKQIKPVGAVQLGDIIVVPLKKDGRIVSAQCIGATGKKSFLTGGAIKGASVLLGSLSSAKTLLMCEGWGTGCTLHESTGHPVVACMSASNLVEMAGRMKGKLSAAVVVCADRDANGVGQKAAQQAAEILGARVVVPEFTKEQETAFAASHDGEIPTDFNDMSVIAGLGAVKELIERKNDGESCTSRQVVLTCGADIKVEPIKWLWEGWLARGKLAILAGPPGVGKTTLSMGLAATVTTGGRWPDGSRCPAGNVLIWSGEDDPADTLVPRLRACGADMNRVFFVDHVRSGDGTENFDPARDMGALMAAVLAAGGVSMAILDPVVSAVAGDSHKNTEVRRALQPIVDFATANGCAVVGITHFSKGGSGKDPLERVSGSIAFGAVARVVLGAAKITDDDGGHKRVFVRVKNNIGPDDGGYEYAVEDGVKVADGVYASRVQFGERMDGSARDILAEPEGDGESTEAKTAEGWLEAVLAAEQVKSKEVKRLGEANGFSVRTIERAKQKLGVESVREGFGKDTTVWWRLPSSTSPASSASPANQKTLAELGKSGGTDEKQPLEPSVDWVEF